MPSTCMQLTAGGGQGCSCLTWDINYQVIGFRIQGSNCPVYSHGYIPNQDCNRQAYIHYDAMNRTFILVCTYVLGDESLQAETLFRT